MGYKIRAATTSARAAAHSFNFNKAIAVSNTDIDLSEFSDADRRAIEEREGSINLASAAFISGYGGLAAVSASVDNLSATLERSPVSLLAGKIAEIVMKLQNADPRKVTKKPGWLDRVTGADLETRVAYACARKSVDTLIEEATRLTDEVTRLVADLETTLSTHADETREIRIALAAGRLHLARHPDAGAPSRSAGAVAFDNPRERFARRLTNIAALLSSYEMGAHQLELSRVAALDMIDRFHEISTVLVPVWRQQTLLLVSSRNNNPESVAAAVSAHDSLIQRLSELRG